MNDMQEVLRIKVIEALIEAVEARDARLIEALCLISHPITL